MPGVLRVKGGGADWSERREWMPSCVDSAPCLTPLIPPYQCDQLPTAMPNCPSCRLKNLLLNNYEKCFSVSQNENSAHFLPHPFPVNERNAVQREEGTQLLSGTENSSRKTQVRSTRPGTKKRK